MISSVMERSSFPTSRNYQQDQQHQSWSSSPTPNNTTTNTSSNSITPPSTTISSGSILALLRCDILQYCPVKIQLLLLVSNAHLIRIYAAIFGSESPIAASIHYVSDSQLPHSQVLLDIVSPPNVTLDPSLTMTLQSLDFNSSVTSSFDLCPISLSKPSPFIQTQLHHYLTSNNPGNQTIYTTTGYSSDSSETSNPELSSYPSTGSIPLIYPATSNSNSNSNPLSTPSTPGNNCCSYNTTDLQQHQQQQQQQQQQQRQQNQPSTPPLPHPALPPHPMQHSPCNGSWNVTPSLGQMSLPPSSATTSTLISSHLNGMTSAANMSSLGFEVPTNPMGASFVNSNNNHSNNGNTTANHNGDNNTSPSPYSTRSSSLPMRTARREFRRPPLPFTEDRHQPMLVRASLNSPPLAHRPPGSDPGTPSSASTTGAPNGAMSRNLPGVDYRSYKDSPYYYSNRAVLKLEHDLNSMTLDWTPAELIEKRRLVRFWRSQEDNVVTASFKPMDRMAYINAISSLTNAPKRPGDTTGTNPTNDPLVVISCIWKEDTNEYFVTSVDTIYLLEAIIASRFSVEEKNRIRRNLEGFKPITVSKAKADSGDFFRLIMSFTSPKPRNIEKNVKVFPWRVLSSALSKIVSKYAAAYSVKMSNPDSHEGLYPPTHAPSQITKPLPEVSDDNLPNNSDCRENQSLPDHPNNNVIPPPPQSFSENSSPPMCGGGLNFYPLQSKPYVEQSVWVAPSQYPKNFFSSTHCNTDETGNCNVNTNTHLSKPNLTLGNRYPEDTQLASTLPPLASPTYSSSHNDTSYDNTPSVPIAHLPYPVDPNAADSTKNFSNSSQGHDSTSSPVFGLQNPVHATRTTTHSQIYHSAVDEQSKPPQFQYSSTPTGAANSTGFTLANDIQGDLRNSEILMDDPSTHEEHPTNVLGITGLYRTGSSSHLQSEWKSNNNPMSNFVEERFLSEQFYHDSPNHEDNNQHVSSYQ